MIQFNLLPDLKLEYIKSQRNKKSMYTIAVFVLIGSLVVLVLLYGALGIQKTRIAVANNKIEDNTKKLQGVKDLDKVITVQNQLERLEELHAQKTASSRLFAYLPQLTPTNASIGQLSISYTDNLLEISGTADTLSTVNKFADTLKLATFTTSGSQDSSKAFTSVVLEKVGRDERKASYTIKAEYDPTLFDGNSNVQLFVPQQTSTRSFTELPGSNIFDGNFSGNKSGGNQ